MKSRCFFSRSLVAMLLVASAASQSSPIGRADHPSAFPKTQQQPAASRTAFAPQAPTLTFAKAVTYNTNLTYPFSIAVGDLNGDGNPDLVVGVAIAGYGDADLSVLLGNGDGTFKAPVNYVSGGAGYMSVAIADVNGDGFPDLVFSDECQSANNCDHGTVNVMLGNGDGTFQTLVSYNSGGYDANFVSIADVNGDGKPDLVVANACQDSNCTGNGNVSVLLGMGNGTFAAPVTYDSGGSRPVFSAIGNLDADGNPDLAVVNNVSNSVGVLLNNGDGTFRPVLTYGSPDDPHSLAIADFNGDGHPDIVVGKENFNSVDVLLGNGDGTFQPAVIYPTAGGASWFVAVADLNGDGHLDVVSANACGNCAHSLNGVMSVLLGAGDGTFQSPLQYPSGGGDSAGLAVGDFNRDGRPDVVVCNQDSGTVGVLLNSTASTTTMSVTSSPNPSLPNQSVKFTATVSSSEAIPDGSPVSFYLGISKIGTSTTTDGVATFTTSFSNAKSYTIKATYAAQGFFKGSLATVTQVVNKYTTTTALVSSLNPSNYGQAVTFTATVTPAGLYPLTADVAFKDGTLAIGGMALSGGVATLTKPKLGVGTHSITATYDGDALNGESVSPAITQNVSQASISMVLTSTPNPSTSGKSVKFTAKLTSNGGFPSGQSVTFSYNNVTLGTAVINGEGVATFSTTTLPQGSDVVTAAYAGSVDYSSASAIVTQVLN
jgi:hypothetical protein